jgi:glucosamine-6-phosphate deaminase
MKRYKKELLDIKVYDTRDEMGVHAAEEAADYIRELMKKQEVVNIVFAAAPSQNDFLLYLSKEDLEWGRINAFHMDEYIGLAKDAPQGFGNYLAEHIFSLVPFRSVNYIYDETKTPEQICEDYERLLNENPTDIIFMGVGENGHIAFNDPHVAFFDDPLGVKIVDLDQKCRNQQVNDGCFATIDQVPTHAITLSIPIMMKAKRIFTIVPTALKAEAIGKIYNGEITQSCPASILRTHKAATLYTDVAGAKEIE